MKIRRLSSLGMIVLAAILVLTLGASTASALDFCRTDPILYLSDGKTLLIDVLVDGVRMDQVDWIDYRVSLPKGVWLAPRASYTRLGGLNNPEFIGAPELVAKERVKIDNNSRPFEYLVEVRVTADRQVRGSVVKVFTQIGWGKPVWVGDKWDWPQGKAPGTPAIMQFSLGSAGTVGQTIKTRLYAQ